MMFKLTCRLFVRAIFRTNSLKLQHLATCKWYGNLAMLGMATVHTEVLMFVCRFDL